MADGPKRRLMLLATLLGLCVLVVIAQLVKVQIIDHQFYVNWARDQRVRSITMDQPPRGTIHDRDGYLLAGNGVRYAIEAAPPYVTDKANAAEKLAEVLHVPALQMRTLLETKDEHGQPATWVAIAPSVSRDIGEEVAKQEIGGVAVHPLWKREYPEGTLASHVLGFSTPVTGYYGIEGFYDTMLRPEPIKWEGPVDIASEPIPWEPIFGEFPRRGVRLELTLDRTVQMLTEQELEHAIWEYEADGGTIIVMDPKTFGILAMASWLPYDPERYGELVEQNPPPFEDPAVSKQYEPGSVFKVLTVAAALDSGTVAPSTAYNDQGWIEVGGQAIWNATRELYGQQSVTGIMVHSLNVGAAWLSTLMGPEIFYSYLQEFGIGRPTGVDLASEVSGQLWLPEDIEHWHPSNLGTNAFGQGVAVTPLQMVTAVATVVNDGARLRPHVVGRRIASTGKVSVFQPVFEQQVISPETAQQVTEMMVQVVEEGATLAQVAGYRVGGKTGTAQIPVPGGYAREGTIATFIGFGPVPDPEVLILVKLDRPQASPWASKTAAPSFARLAARLFVVLGIPPDGESVLAEVQQ